MWDLVGNPEDRFSQNEAHIILGFGVTLYVDVVNVIGAILNECKIVKIIAAVFGFEKTTRRAMH